MTHLVPPARLAWRDACTRGLVDRPLARGTAVTDLPDARLVADTLAGIPQAFEAIMRRHYAAVWRVALLSTRDQMAAEEITQDTFLKAYGALAQ